MRQCQPSLLIHSSKIFNKYNLSQIPMKVVERSMVRPLFRSRLQPPVSEEGFSEIVLVNFVPAFTDEEKRALYGKYLLEK